MGTFRQRRHCSRCSSGSRSRTQTSRSSLQRCRRRGSAGGALAHREDGRVCCDRERHCAHNLDKVVPGYPPRLKGPRELDRVCEDSAARRINLCIQLCRPKKGAVPLVDVDVEESACIRGVPGDVILLARDPCGRRVWRQNRDCATKARAVSVERGPATKQHTLVARKTKFVWQRQVCE